MVIIKAMSTKVSAQTSRIHSNTLPVLPGGHLPVRLRGSTSSTNEAANTHTRVRSYKEAWPMKVARGA